MYEKIVKRLLDFAFSIVFIILSLPLLIFISIIIKIESKGPVLFTQSRVGKNKKIFKIYKFRTMKIETPSETPTHMLSDSRKYITRFGSILRKTSLDEIPQLFNIFLSEMSFVGPRPALWNQFDLIAERDKYDANSLRPGLTGWAQINGRDEISIQEKALLDGEYRRQVNPIFDIKCIILTIVTVITQKGIKEGR